MPAEKVIATIHQGVGPHAIVSQHRRPASRCGRHVSAHRRRRCSAKRIAGSPCSRKHGETRSRSGRREGLRRAVRRMPWRQIGRHRAVAAAGWSRRSHERRANHRHHSERQKPDARYGCEMSTDLEALLRFLRSSPDRKGARTPTPRSGQTSTSSPATANSSTPMAIPPISTPWGTLNAIDLKTGKYLWKVPFGEYPALAKQGIKNTGTENYGGPVVTASGVLFIGATVYDHKLRAFDTSTGKLLWEGGSAILRCRHAFHLHGRRPPIRRDRSEQRAHPQRSAGRHVCSFLAASRNRETSLDFMLTRANSRVLDSQELS